MIIGALIYFFLSYCLLADFAFGQKVVLECPGLSYAFGMRATCKTPVTAAKFTRTKMVHLVVVDECVGADISSTPALAGKRQALAPAARALGSATTGCGRVRRAIQRTVIKRK